MKKTLLRKSPLRKVSNKRSSQLSRYSKLRKAYLEEFPICEVCKSVVACDVHHRKGKIGELLNQTSFWLSTCRYCHERMHAEPIWATKMGYTISRLGQ